MVKCFAISLFAYPATTAEIISSSRGVSPYFFFRDSLIDESTNVRKHSGAKQVLVQLLEVQGRWELIIEDNGIGFPFSGRVSQSELDSTARAPAIIRERVRLIHGELTIESKPGRGSRVEISVPQEQNQQVV